MYKVLLVDDERIILDGISQLVDWSALGTTLAGTAANGIEAYERILREAPDIVVSDIRMPGMDGLGLVQRVSESHPDIKFVILSGFGEFEYASKAMQYGVKHYLLKPTNERKIGEALTELVAELDHARRKDAFVRDMKDGLAKLMPHVKEQVLKEFVTNKTYGSREWDYYRDLFRFEIDAPVRLLLFRLEGNDFEFEHLFALKNIAEDLLESTLLGTTIGDHVLILIEDTPDLASLYRRIQEIRCTFRDYYKRDTTIALSEPNRITHARSLYRETLQCLGYRFYLGEGSLITLKDTAEGAQGGAGADAFSFPEERLTMPVRSGHREEAEQALADFIEALRRAGLAIEQTKSYAIQQYVSLIRHADPARLNEYYARIPALVELGTLQAIHAFLGETVRELTERHYEQNVVKHTAIVRKVIAIVDDHLGDSQLSLNSVASEMLYMNADYLGKLFKKETGEKFSNYVMKARIKQATERMTDRPDIKVFELAEQLGFGDNPQYFSQVFKKYAGCTPSEFMKTAHSSAF
ncbi:response regulator [Cohnella nanjingensis]|uniref:Response regulator n=1 Tax=Cohnella nanjingensis TaxID=1387779 RepID=A0A7X0VDN7_9BACL|nr:response regulator [Cohnella nanjingensis]MBB6670147.1 response regulator [Cohnella nanjingensis]